MEAVELHLPETGRAQPGGNPLPQLLQTPAGFAILEIQGTIHLPECNTADKSNDASTVGKIVFPLYSVQSSQAEQSWMKRVYLYVGKHQRLTGEVKKLGKPLAIIRKQQHCSDSDEDPSKDLEIAEIIRYKLIFSSRPEPVGEDAVP